MLKKMLWLICIVALIASGMAPAPAWAAAPKPRVALIVDADTGVDDAAALAYLLKQPGSQHSGHHDGGGQHRRAECHQQCVDSVGGG